MDKWLINMIAGATLAALLVVFGTNTFVNIIYPRGGEPEASTGHESAAGEAAGGSEAAAPAEPKITLAALLSQGKADAGEAQAKKCAACHSFDEGGPNKIGPNLHGVVGRPVASHEGFAYSEALKSFGGNWDYEKLNCFIHSPKDCVKGTKMSFAGVKKDGDRADVIAYLRSISPNAPPLPEDKSAAAAPEEKAAEAKPAETPAAPKQEAAKAPAESKPAAEPKAAEATPAAETKPAEAKPAETTPAEAKPAEAKPAEGGEAAEAAPSQAQPAANPPAETAAPSGANASATSPVPATQN